jgi:hypothetical protein
MSTRYNDCRYHIKARVTDVRNGYTDSPVQNVVIDDYKPFIPKTYLTENIMC